MATLDYADDDDIEAAKADPILTWNWATWPGNLRRASVFALAVLAGTVAAIYLLGWSEKDLGRKLKAQVELQQAAQKKLQNSDQERIDIESNLPLLRQLEATGIFGEEKRLEWIELLRTIEKRWPGVRIQYAISAQSLQNKNTGGPEGAAAPAAAPAVPMPNGEPAKNFGVFHTEMKLSLNLLHEGDALAIIDELKAAQLGRFTVRKCSFKRVNNEATTGAVAFGRPLDAECALTWISMRAYAPT